MTEKRTASIPDNPHRIKILIASPSDVKNEQKAAAIQKPDFHTASTPFSFFVRERAPDEKKNMNSVWRHPFILHSILPCSSVGELSLNFSIIDASELSAQTLAEMVEGY
jgi:hypothetical protein